ncbi:hypothetical protein CSH63_05085 [Micromonospora tulbaghiae]|uniref:Uncharacterized protein n=1 Tax=Micromonospora tulbaghiae TaxID=479978 RepID=A0A386WHB3_9ACTN|nr:hypothetical protein [Micromonospora tulbaghiae]AYF26840.1 hypothetical protein CSH63_05085 [Micromonospora tulbaghiae]
MSDPYAAHQPQQPYQQGNPGYTTTPQHQSTAPAQTHVNGVDPTGLTAPAAAPARQARHSRSEPSRRKPLLIAIGAALVMLLLAAIAIGVYEGFIKEDSAVAACKSLRDCKKADGGEKGSDDEDKLTETEYRNARKLFEDSRHEKLREHGTALIDITWQVSNLPEGQETGALAFVSAMGTHMASLQTACADQGVIVNLNHK